MTSAGSAKIWASYGAVSAAKAALESHTRQLAFELSSQGIAVNSLRAGVTDTPSLRKIPGHEEMIEIGKKRNPGGRITTPEGTDTPALVGALQAFGDVFELVELDGIGGVAIDPDNQFFDFQYALENTGQFEGVVDEFVAALSGGAASRDNLTNASMCARLIHLAKQSSRRSGAVETL